MPRRDYRSKEDYKARHTKWLSKGLCYSCGVEPPRIGRKTCVRCSNKQKENKRGVFNRRKISGLCTSCGQCPPRHDKTLCEGCAYKASVRDRKTQLKKYGLVPEQYVSLVKAQKGKCAICNLFVSTLHVDHNHYTGEVRELLCANCNRGIGFLKESVEVLQAAINYIQKHKKVLRAVA